MTEINQKYTGTFALINKGENSFEFSKMAIYSRGNIKMELNLNYSLVSFLYCILFGKTS